MVCGGSYTLSQFLSKFMVSVVNTAYPSTADIGKANAQITTLHWEATREKVRAQALAVKSDITLLNTVLENLDFARKCLHSMLWARNIEAKVGLPDTL